MERLKVSVGGLDLKTPLILASGCAGYGTEWDGLVDTDAIGAVVLKGVSLTPWAGNPPPRVTEVAGGVVNAIGLENVGLEVLMREKLPALDGAPFRVVANVVGRTTREYIECCAALNDADRVDAVELNVSCPNVKQGGLAFGAEPASLRSLVRDCRDVALKPLWVKLPPMVTDVVALAKAAAAAGADALTIANTIPAMVIDIQRRRPVLGNVYGGLSGQVVAPVNIRLVHRVRQTVAADIIGSGGIVDWETAVAYVLAGAKGLQVGTLLFSEPSAVSAIAARLVEYLDQQGFEDLTAAVGALG